ncbi:divergent polysaccharide deacetylase family protein [Pseudodonghicola sp.]|uniref:divergent polysaccharide deacetylase family protein n=1 Tax=Pseudodonghicola sp. TaxID=1969463 RepID=UPI003A96BBF0
MAAMRGFFGGFGLGAVVVVVGSGALSLLMPLPQRPEVGQAPTASAGAPEETTGRAGIETKGNDADLVEAMPKAPVAGGAADELKPLDTAPAAKPSVGAATEGLAGPITTAAAPEVSIGADNPDLPKAPGAGPEAPGTDKGVSIASEPAQPAAPALPETDSGLARLETETHSETPADQVEPAEEAAAAPATEEAAAPRIAALPQAGTDAAPGSSPLGTPVKPLTDREAAPVAAEGPTPLALYSAPFDNAEGRPLMSIILIDDAQSIGAEALADFPYPLTFAIDPTEADAATKMQTYRDAGFEVVLLADLPVAATPQDAEVSLSVWRSEVPEAVAILEGPGSGIQGNRPLSDQVTEIARSAGLGLITESSGLNTVQKLAAREGVPSAVVFRDFDGAGQTPTVMRRFLDQAAFRASQEGTVIMLGRVRPDTVSALLLWGLQDRAQRVALAPVSAVLTHKPEAAPQD